MHRAYLCPVLKCLITDSLPPAADPSQLPIRQPSEGASRMDELPFARIIRTQGPEHKPTRYRIDWVVKQPTCTHTFIRLRR